MWESHGGLFYVKKAERSFKYIDHFIDWGFCRACNLCMSGLQDISPGLCYAAGAMVHRYFAGDLFSSMAFDLLFSMIELPIRGLYSILRILGCLIITYVLFWLYTTKILHLKMKDFRITCSIRKWAVLYAAILPSFVVICYVIIGSPIVTTSNPAEIVIAVIYSIIAALKAGVLEEMLFRGYILKLLETKWGKPVAPSFHGRV